MGKKRRPPKPKKPARQKKYNPKKYGDDDYAGATGVMQGITRGLKSVVGADVAAEESGGHEGAVAGTSRLVLGVWWLIALGIVGFAVYQFVQ